MKLKPYLGGSFAKNDPAAQQKAKASMRKYRYTGEEEINLAGVGVLKTGAEFSLEAVIGAKLMANDKENFIDVTPAPEPVVPVPPVKPAVVAKPAATPVAPPKVEPAAIPVSTSGAIRV